MQVPAGYVNNIGVPLQNPCEVVTVVQIAVIHFLKADPYRWVMHEQH